MLHPSRSTLCQHTVAGTGGGGVDGVGRAPPAHSQGQSAQRVERVFPGVLFLVKGYGIWSVSIFSLLGPSYQTIIQARLALHLNDETTQGLVFRRAWLTIPMQIYIAE